jgi:hypothetical protein
MANFTNTIKEEEFRSATGDKKMILKTGKREKEYIGQKDKKTDGQTDKRTNRQTVVERIKKRVCVL